MKNQIKKSLSLIMAVLMILSCWVWVAPDKAEAKSFYSTYTVKIEAYSTNAVDNEASVTIKHTGNTSGQKFTWSAAKAGDKVDASQSFEVSGWPSSINFLLTTNTMTKHEIKVTKIWINDVCIFNDSYTMSKGAFSDGKTNETLTYNGKWGSWSFSSYWTQPKFTDVREIQVSNDIDVTKLPNGAEKTATVSVKNGYDQYGVPFDGTVPSLSSVSYALKYTDAAGKEQTFASNSTQAKISGSTQSATVTVYDDVQTLFPNSSNGKIYAYLTYNGETRSIPVNLTFPTYDITFDANGGKIGSSDSDANDQVKTEGIKYGGIIGKSPAYRTRPGYEFKGFYSEQNADANGLNASFSGTKFVDSETTVGTQGDMTYYAAWQSTPITATFMTADNQLIGTVEGRYGNYLTNSNMYNGLDGLNTAVKQAYDSAKQKAVEEGKKYADISFNGNTPVYKDGSTSYVFSHWQVIKGYGDNYDDDIVDAIENGNDKHAVLKGDVTFKAVYKRADETDKYTVKFYDGNGNVMEVKDKDGNKVEDYYFREPVIMPSTVPSKGQDDKYNYEFIGWASKLDGVNYFAVDANDKDETGAIIAYTSKDAASFTVRGDAEYVPVFRMSAREYNVTFNYKVDGGNTESVTVGGYHLDDTLKMPEGIKDNYTAGGYRYYIDGWKKGTETKKQQLADIKVKGDIVLTATYGAGQGAKYTINFYDKDGKLIKDGNNIYEHNAAVTAPTVVDGEAEGFAIPLEIKTEDSLYTFKEWSPSVNATATADAEYRAIYTKKDYADIQLFNYDETPLLEKPITGNFVGDKIPKNIYEGTPEKPKDATGSYEFIGWSTKVNAESEDDIIELGKYILTGDINLYAQYETTYNEYTVKFLNDDGTVVSEKKYHYAAEVEVPANPTKAPDAAYKYEFKSWSPEVSKVCYGDATYTATYRRDYNYYVVKWLNENKQEYKTAKYRYGAKITPATITKEGSPEPGHTYGFDYWVQCNASGEAITVNGEPVIFERGMTMGTETLYFYPVFKSVPDPVTVTFYDANGNKLETVDFGYNASLEGYTADFITEALTKSTDEHHYILTGFVNYNNEAEVVTTVTEDISVKMVEGTQDHNMVKHDIVDSTYNVHGYADYICEDGENNRGCGYTKSYIELPLERDINAPTGKIYVGSNQWTSDNFASIDYNDVKYVAPNAQLVVNTNDEQRGVSKIEYYVCDTEDGIIGADNITDWVEIYNYEEIKAAVLAEVLEEYKITQETYESYAREDAAGKDKLTKAAIDREVEANLKAYKANASAIISSLGLEDGKEYIIYIKVSDTDAEGNGRSSNATVFSSGKFSYGTNAAEIAVSGDGFGTKFCADATVTVTDDYDGFKVYLDGEEKLTADTTTATISVDTEGTHTVTVEDKHGNKTSKIFEIKGGHNYRTYKIAATCLHDGSEYKLCTVCGAKTVEKVLTKLGHSFAKNYTDKAPTCTADGSRTYVCDNSNCGETKTIGFDKEHNFVGDLTYVKVWNDDDQVYEAADAADFDHLKSLGGHTYAKDENGNEIWIVDKAPTCKDGNLGAGKKHKTCEICGFTVETTMERDPDGHKFYSEDTTEATCTAEGKISKTCRYCGHEELIETIPALGHFVDEEDKKYEEILAPTCEAAGKKILLCNRCDAQIGEADEDGSFDINKTVEIPALGHAWIKDGEIEERVDENGEKIYVQKYKCNNKDCTGVKEEILTDYVKPEEVTITFTYGDSVQTFKKYVGETIVESDVTKPVKEADATYKYTFAAWVDADNNAVKFPIEVKAGAAYTATFNKKYINYTVTYYREDGRTEFKTTGYLHNGDVVKLAAAPAKAEDSLNTYTFTGWQVINSNEVYTENVTINGADINLKATYEGVKKTYRVFYALSKEDYLEYRDVEAGTEAPALSNEFTAELVKKSDTKFHYTFDGWNEAEALKAVKRDIYATPVFKSEKHNLNSSVIEEATCTTNEVVLYECTCEACDYSYEEEVLGTMLDHDWGEPKLDKETGKKYVTCQNDGCDEEQDSTLSYTIKFFKNATDSKPYYSKYYVPWGESIEAPKAPVKEAEENTSYEFIGWKDMDTNEFCPAEEIANIEIKKNYNFVAVFEAIPINYTVTFAYDAENVIKIVYDVPVDADIAAMYGNDPLPTKAPDKKGHYEFAGWTVGTPKDHSIYVTAKFTTIDHDDTNVIELKEATCTSGKGMIYWCNCNGNVDENGAPKFDDKVAGEYVDYYYDKTEGDPKGHDYEVINEVEATPEADGYTEYKCKECGKTKKDTHKYQDNSIRIQVKVTRNGAAQSNVQLIVMENTATAVPLYGTTNTNGVATVTGVKGVNYSAYVVIDGKEIKVELKADASGNLSGTYSYVDQEASCGCACHRDNLWGKIFRFFHKIIKLFTGEFKCCGNPDPLYG